MNDAAVKTDFKPAWWLPGGHLQTLWRKFTSVQPVAHARERVELADGDFIDLDWASASREFLAGNPPAVLVLHGLCGSSRSSYVCSLQARLTVHGYPNVALNFRGCSGELNRKARAYHSGVTEDLHAVLEYLRAAYPRQQWILVGYSLGANVTLKWLGEQGSPRSIVAAAAVSTPFSLAYCSHAMKSGLGQYYGRYFLNKLVADTERKKANFRQLDFRSEFDMLEACGDLQSLESLWDFDDKVTAPLHGFADADDYYARCSSLQFLSAIRTPTLLVQSLDDPIIPPGALPRTDQLNNSIHVDLSPRGGHVGFVSTAEPFWLENRVIRFIREQA